MTVIDAGEDEPESDFGAYPDPVGRIIDIRDCPRPLEKRHHPECPTKTSVENKCQCRKLYDADYEDGFGMPLR